jgi:hypothetical protein
MENLFPGFGAPNSACLWDTTLTIACGNAAVDWLEPDVQEMSDAEDEVMFDVSG